MTKCPTLIDERCVFAAFLVFIFLFWYSPSFYVIGVFWGVFLKFAALNLVLLHKMIMFDIWLCQCSVKLTSYTVFNRLLLCTNECTCCPLCFCFRFLKISVCVHWMQKERFKQWQSRRMVSHASFESFTFTESFPWTHLCLYTWEKLVWENLWWLNCL